MEGCGSVLVATVMQTLIHDYCEVQGAEAQGSCLQHLPQLSANFTCVFVTAITASYQPPGGGCEKGDGEGAGLIRVCLHQNVAVESM